MTIRWNSESPTPGLSDRTRRYRQGSRRRGLGVLRHFLGARSSWRFRPLNPFAVLSAVAQRTSTIKLGTGCRGPGPAAAPSSLPRPPSPRTSYPTDGWYSAWVSGESIPRTWKSRGYPISGSGDASPTRRLEILYRLFTEKNGIPLRRITTTFEDFTLTPEPVQKAPCPHLDRGAVDGQDIRCRPKAGRDLRRRIHLPRRHPHGATIPAPGRRSGPTQRQQAETRMPYPLCLHNLDMSRLNA